MALLCWATHWLLTLHPLLTRFLSTRQVSFGPETFLNRDANFAAIVNASKSRSFTARLLGMLRLEDRREEAVPADLRSVARYRSEPSWRFGQPKNRAIANKSQLPLTSTIPETDRAISRPSRDEPLQRLLTALCIINKFKQSLGCS